MGLAKRAGHGHQGWGCQGGNASPQPPTGRDLKSPGFVVLGGGGGEEKTRPHHQHTLQEQQPLEEGIGRNPKG